MRTLVLSAAALLASATTVFAAPASVSVTIGPELQAKATKTLGVRDVNDLAAELKTTIEKRLAKTGAYDGARIELVLVGRQVNWLHHVRQLGDTPGLSCRALGSAACGSTAAPSPPTARSLRLATNTMRAISASRDVAVRGLTPNRPLVFSPMTLAVSNT